MCVYAGVAILLWAGMLWRVAPASRVVLGLLGLAVLITGFIVTG